MVEGYPSRMIAPGVHMFGPHRELFWMGNYQPLRKRFASLTDAIEDKSTTAYTNAGRFVEMIDLDRERFVKVPDNEAPFWLVNMPVVNLPGPTGGLLVYSPVPLDAQGRLRVALNALGPVRVVIAPHAFHTAGLPSFRAAYPDALFICPKGSQLTGGKSLSEMKPEIGFQAIVEDEASVSQNSDLATLMTQDIAAEVMNDATFNEIILYHKPSKTMINADTVYKAPSFETVPGVGGPDRQYMGPNWFAEAYQALLLDPPPSSQGCSTLIT